MILQRLHDPIEKLTTQMFYSEQTWTRIRKKIDLKRLVPVPASSSPHTLYSLLNLAGEKVDEKPWKWRVRIPYDLWVPLGSNEMQEYSPKQGETTIKVKFTWDWKK